MKILLIVLLVLMVGCLEEEKSHPWGDGLPSEVITGTEDFFDEDEDLEFRFIDCDVVDCPKDLGMISFIVPETIEYSAWIDGEMKTFSIDVSKDSRCLDAEEMKILRLLYRFQEMSYSERVEYRK